MCEVKFELKPFKPKGYPAPVMPIIFENPNNQEIFQNIGIIDSGADFCTLPYSVALYPLRLDLEKSGAEQRNVECACGNKNFFGYIFKINAIVMDTKKRKIYIPVKVNFVKSETPPIIGRNFMDYFDKMIYDNREKCGFFIKDKEND